MPSEREIPWCTIFLVVGALACQVLVLRGNLDTAQAFAELGTSTTGWSNVGLGLSTSMSQELDVLMANTSLALNTAIVHIQQLHGHMDFSFGMAGGLVDDVLAKYRDVREEFLQEQARARERAEYDEDGSNVTESMLQDMPLCRVVTNEAGKASLRVLPAERPVASVMVQQTTSKSGIIARHTKAVLAAGGHLPAAESGTPPTSEAMQHLLDTVWESIAGGNSNGTAAVPSPEEFKAKLMSSMSKVAAKLTGKVGDKLQTFLEHIKPALVQIGKWLESFSDAMQAKLEGFSASMDKVQSIFNQLMAQVSQNNGAGLDLMLHDLYALFDTDEKGFVVADDLTAVADLYGIVALKGSKARELFAKYDSHRDGKLHEHEFALMVQDESISGAMPTILRTYSKKLSVLSGQISSARMRDEVASAVVDYVTLVCAKNMSRVYWVSQALTNKSLPIQFTAVLLKNLADKADNPDQLTDADVGSVMVKAMSDLSAEYVGVCLALLMDPEFWQSEGFTLADQPASVERIARWLIKVPAAQTFLDQHLQKFLQDGSEGFPRRVRDFTKARSTRYAKRERQNQSGVPRGYYNGGLAQSLQSSLLGGIAASAANLDPAQKQAVMKGQPAVSETLLFAQWLANNATSNARRLERQCFDFASTSSSAMDNFVDQMQSMVKKMQSFLGNVEEFATPSGVERLEDMAANFTQAAAQDVANVLEGYLDKALDSIADPSGDSLLQHGVHIEVNVTGLVGRLTTLLTSLQQMLPAVVDDLKFARKEVSAVSHTMHVVFSTFREKGSPIFAEVSRYYARLWTAYFVLFGSLTIATLFYALWASGWLGGPEGEDEKPAGDGYAAPRTFGERCCTCLGSCCSCFMGNQDANLCFWSVVLLMQVLVLILFCVSIALCLLAGIKAFMSAGCSAVYVLSDDAICSGVLGMLSRWLTTFFADNPNPIQQVCSDESLLTCQVIGARLKTSTLFTTGGSLLAAVLSFQMIIESAVLHEKARWKRIYNEETKGM